MGPHHQHCLRPWPGRRPQKVAYVAAKHGVVGATKVAGIETANDGVTFNAICPGWVLTPLVQRQLEDRAKEAGTVVRREKEMLPENQPMHEIHHAGGNRRAGGVPMLRRRRDHNRHADLDRWRLGRAMIGTSIIDFLARAFGGGGADKPDKPNGAEARQPRLARRRRAWRLRLGRARSSARRRAAGDRRHIRHLGRRRQRGDGRRRTESAAGREEARKRLGDFWRAASLGGDLPAVQRAVTDKLFSLLPGEGSPTPTGCRPGRNICRLTISTRSTSIRSRT